MTWLRLTTLLLFVLTLPSHFGSTPPALAGESPAQHRIIIVHSYEPGQVCGEPQARGLLTALDRAGYKEGKNLLVEHVYMYTKTKNADPENIRAVGRSALEKVHALNPDLVVAIDDNAIHTVMLPLAGSNIPVIFSGMNVQPETLNQIKSFMLSREHPGNNVTGVYEKLYFVKSLQVMNDISPQKKIAVLVDSSPTGTAILAEIKKELADQPVPFDISFHQTGEFEEFKQKILSINNDPEVTALYPAVTTLKTMDGQSLGTSDIITWFLANSRKVGLAPNHSFSELGMFGGAAVDFFTMGIQAGEKAAAVLGGVTPGTLPIEDAVGQTLVFNLERAQQLGVQIPIELLGAADIQYDRVQLKRQPPRQSS